MKVGDTIIIRGVVTSIGDYPVIGDPAPGRIVGYSVADSYRMTWSIYESYISEVISGPWVPKVGDTYRTGLYGTLLYKIIAMSDKWYFCQNITNGLEDRNPLPLSRDTFLNGDRQKVEP